jgi:hypothetical protein
LNSSFFVLPDNYCIVISAKVLIGLQCSFTSFTKRLTHFTQLDAAKSGGLMVISFYKQMHFKGYEQKKKHIPPFKKDMLEIITRRKVSP